METVKVRPVYRSSPLDINCLYRPGRKGALLFIEGLGCSLHDFAPAFTHPALKEYTLAAFDFPGMGGSPYPPGLHLDIDDLVEITELTAQELDLADFVIAGHSMGGLVALLYAGRYPQRVRGFINIEGNLASEDCFFSRRIAGLSTAEQAETKIKSLVKKLARSQEKGVAAYASALGQASPQACLDYAKLTVEYSDSGGLLERYMTLPVPALFLYGERNRSLSYLPQLKEEGLRTAEVAEGGHFLFHDNPGEFYRCTAQFLKEIYP